MCYLLAPKVQIQGLTYARQARYLAELKTQAVYKSFKRLEDVPKFYFLKMILTPSILELGTW